MGYDLHFTQEEREPQKNKITYSRYGGQNCHIGSMPHSLTYRGGGKGLENHWFRTRAIYPHLSVASVLVHPLSIYEKERKYPHIICEVELIHPILQVKKLWYREVKSFAQVLASGRVRIQAQAQLLVSRALAISSFPVLLKLSRARDQLMLFPIHHRLLLL